MTDFRVYRFRTPADPTKAVKVIDVQPTGWIWSSFTEISPQFACGFSTRDLGRVTVPQLDAMVERERDYGRINGLNGRTACK